MLKTIEEHNQEVLRTSSNRNKFTGVECPNCKEELQFKDNTMMLSSPPQKNVICFNCGYANRIFVKFGDHS